MQTSNSLVVIWSSNDRDVALQTVFLYVLNSRLKGWWEDVTLIVWGPSAELLSYDLELQMELEKIRAAGVKIQACRKCTDNYGVSDKLEELGIEVIYMGVPLTEYIREARHILTF